MDTYLGIDIGTSHIKAVMIDDRGKVLQKDSVVTPTTEDGIGAVHDAQQLVSACQTIVRQIISSHPQAQVKAISVASFGEEGFLLDERNQPVYASIAWYEQRPICHHGKLASNMYTQQETGLIPSLSYSLFKWFWIKENHWASWQAGKTWLPVSDYIGFVLTGCMRISYSQACRTYAFNPLTKCWIPYYVEEALPCGIDALPEPVAAGYILGQTSDNAQDWGLHSGTAVVVGGHDHSVGAFGAGALNTTQVLDSVGTSEVFYWPISHLDANAMISGFEYGYTGYPNNGYYVESTIYTGLAINALRRLFHLSDDEIGNIQSANGSHRLPFVIPARLGQITPFDIRSIYDTTTAADIILATLRSSAMAFRKVLERGGKSLSTKSEIIIIGGGASPQALSIKADVLQLPLRHISGSETVSWGAASLARQALTGQEPHVATYQTIQPNPKMKAYYDDLYNDFGRLW